MSDPAGMDMHPAEFGTAGEQRHCLARIEQALGVESALDGVEGLQLGGAELHAHLVDLFHAQLRSSCRFDTEKDSLQVLGDGGAALLNSEGKPKQADAWVSEILDASPLLKPKASPGSGAAGSGGKTETKPSMAEADLGSKSPREMAEFFKAGGVIVG